MYKLTYKSMFSHLTGTARNELMRGTRRECLERMEVVQDKFYDLKVEKA